MWLETPGISKFILGKEEDFCKNFVIKGLLTITSTPDQAKIVYPLHSRSNPPPYLTNKKMP
jgi:hypothetical protein